MTSADIDVLVVGSLHLDIVVKAQNLPALDETARGSSWGMVCGGKGGNQACWAAKTGAKTAMISRIGDDDFGRRLVSNLMSCGVDVASVGTDAHAGSGMSVAIQVASGEYGAVIVSGSNLKLDATWLLPSFSKLGAIKVLVLQNEIPEAANIIAAREAKARGAKVILNAAPAQKLSEALAAHIDILVVNRVEAQMLSGKPANNFAEAQIAITALGSPMRDVIITLGGEGLVVAENVKSAVCIAPIKVQVVSTHGAGDCFIGQLASAIAQGKNLLDAATLANSTASAFVGGKIR
jgi:ribokinase